MMNTNQPLVSAIITTKNRPVLLRRALTSVIAQTYNPVEIVVVDDGSDAKTKAVVDDFKQNRKLVYKRNKISQGAPRARNQAIEMAKGIFIAGLDDDDEWHPKRLAHLVGAYRDSYSCVTSNVKMKYANYAAVWRKKSEIALDLLLYSNQVGNQVLAKRSRLLEVGGFDENLEAAQDYDLWIRLCSAYGPIKNVKKTLQIIHQEHEHERISNARSQLKGYLKFLKKHKAKMNIDQRKYQLYNIRLAQGKQSGLLDMLGWVPPTWYGKEAKRWLAQKLRRD